MHIRHHPHDSVMARFLHANDVYTVYTSPQDVQGVTLTGAEIIALITAHCVQARLVLSTAAQLTPPPPGRWVYRRRLLGQHKALRGQAPSVPET